jgi:hypothetical protein
MTIRFDLTGKQFGYWKVISLYCGGRRTKWNCECVCGKVIAVRAFALKSGASRSCGCKSGFANSQKTSLPNNQGVINLLFRQYDYGAIRRNFKFELSLEEFTNFIFQDCHYCGRKPYKTKMGGGVNRFHKEIAYNGIDRVNSNLNYTIGNSVSCCIICNRAKNDMELEEFISWIDNMCIFRNKIAVNEREIDIIY